MCGAIVPFGRRESGDPQVKIQSPQILNGIYGSAPLHIGHSRMEFIILSTGAVGMTLERALLEIWPVILPTCRSEPQNLDTHAWLNYWIIQRSTPRPIQRLQRSGLSSPPAKVFRKPNSSGTMAT